MDDTFAPDGGRQRTIWQRKHNALSLSPEPGKRPISVAFPYPLFWRIKRMADAGGMGFTRQVVILCRCALDADINPRISE